MSISVSTFMPRKMILHKIFGVLSLAIVVQIVSCERDGSLTFVIDNTYSMTDEITQVKNAVEDITKAILTKSSQIKNIVLVTFNDDINGAPSHRILLNTTSMTSSSAHHLRDVLHKVQVNGGGDCPEQAMTGIRTALQESYDNSYLFVFTDASAKDEHLTDEIISIAQRQGTQITFVLTPQDVEGSIYWGCKPNDELKAYYKIASATYGQVFRLGYKSDVRKFMDAVVLTSSGETSIICVSEVVPANEWTYVSFTVDDQTEYVIISVSGMNIRLQKLEQFSGHLEVILNTEHAKMLKLTSLSSKTYKIKVYGDSTSTVRIFGRTDFTFQYGFSEQVTSLNHTSKQPTTGIKYNLIISVTDPGQTVDVHFAEIYVNGTVVDKRTLRKIGENLYSTPHILSPESEFQIAIQGTGIYSHKEIKRYAKTPITPLIVPQLTIKGLGVCNYNSDLSLTCSVKANPKPEITWIDDKGRTIPSEISATNHLNQYQSRLTLVAVKKSQTYHCQATNIAGAITTNVDVSVASPFKLPNSYKNKDVIPIYIEYGKRGDLNCDISSHYPLIISWSRESITSPTVTNSEKYILSNNNRILTINRMSQTFEGIYICKAQLKNDPDRNISISYNVHLNNTAPKIQLSSNHVTATEGTDVEIQCQIVQGYPKPTVTWRFKGHSDSDYRPLHVSTEILRIAPIYLRHSGQYKCIAENSAGRDEQEVQVIVEAPPKIIDTVEKQYVAEEDDLDLTVLCKTIGYPKPTITWKFNGSVITSGSKYTIKDDALVIHNPIQVDNGNYTCKAVNKIGTDEKIFGVNFKYASESAYSITYVYILNGNTDQLTCPHSKTDAVKWYKEYIFMNLRNATWTIKNADSSIHDGNYTCHTRDGDGNRRIHKFVVEVGYPPTRFQYAFSERFFDWKPDQNKYLNCKAESKPIADVEWTRNGKVINETSFDLPLLVWRWGNYTCRVKNPLGGGIERNFQVFSSNCFINKDEISIKTPLLLMSNGRETEWPKVLPDTYDLFVKQNETVLISCKTPGMTNGIQNIAGNNFVMATCDHEDKFEINGVIHAFADIQCISPVIAKIQSTGKKCLNDSTELLKVGFEFGVNNSLQVYQVCLDTSQKVPLYTKAVMHLGVNSAVVEESEWDEHPELGKDTGTYGCANNSNECCITKSQLVNAQDVSYGPAYRATFIDRLNSVPIWTSCLPANTVSWNEIEHQYRARLSSTTRNFTIWTGSSDYVHDNGNFVPRYLWKVARFPSENDEPEDPVAIVYVNDPSPVEEDVLCNGEGPCSAIDFTFSKYTYCCSLSEFSRVFGIPEATFSN